MDGLQVTNMPFSQYCDMWTEYISVFKEILDGLDGAAPNAATTTRLGRLSYELGVLKSCIALGHPKCVRGNPALTFLSCCLS